MSEICRICFDETLPLVSPCNCKGTQKYVHSECLKLWRYSHPDRYSQCNVCRYSYNNIFSPLSSIYGVISIIGMLIVSAYISYGISYAITYITFYLFIGVYFSVATICIITYTIFCGLYTLVYNIYIGNSTFIIIRL